MAYSGTKTFALNIADTIEEAYELAGLEQRTGYDARTARRSLNIMFADWANRGVNLWTIEEVVLNLVISAVVRDPTTTPSTDIEIDRIGRQEYLNIPNKTTQARPTQYFVDRQITPVVNIWPTPDNNNYQLVSYRIQRIDDVNSSAEDPEVPSRFIPCMVSGLSYYIALKKNPSKAGLLKQQYEQDFKLAADEDRNRASLMLTPSRRFY